MNTSPLMTPDEILPFLDGPLAHARATDYHGWSKHDGLNSPLLRACAFGSGFLRLCMIQGVLRFPLNLRPFLGIPRLRNNKGIALFAKALLDRAAALGDEASLAEARGLLDWLTAHPGPSVTGLGWGYPHPWQNGGFHIPPLLPNRVVTIFAANALLDGYETLGEDRYLDTAGKAAVFLLNAPNRIMDTDDHLCLSYVPVERDQWRVINVSILTSAFLARHAAITGDKTHLPDARRLAAWAVSRKTDYDAWYYTDPPSASPITHDNYHTGFILEGLCDYMRFSGDYSWVETYRRGLAWYREHLFEPDGAPKWMHDRCFPHDVHGAATGILAFSQGARTPEWAGEGCREQAHKIARWACANLWLPESRRFAWQRTSHGLKTHDLLRWCQGWMARALGALLRDAK